MTLGVLLDHIADIIRFTSLLEHENDDGEIKRHAGFPDINAACTQFSRLMAKMRKSSKWIRQFVSLYHDKVAQASVCFVNLVSQTFDVIFSL